MKKLLAAAAVAASIALGFSVTACALGLEPASNEKTGKTSISFTLPVLPGSEPVAETGRAIVQGSGYLYIQTGMTAADGIVYGPFPAAPGVPVVVSSIPAGSYPYFALIYVKNPDTNAHTAPIIPAVASSDGYLAALQTLWSSDTDTKCTSSFSFLTNVAIHLNEVNTISASLIPTTDYTATSSIMLPGASGTITKRFVKLTGVSAGFLSTGYTNMVCSANSTSGGIMRTVGLYDGSGHMIAWFPNPAVINQIDTVTYTARWNGGDTYYMYFEFDSYEAELAFTAAP